jgi:hypothetical protein
MIQSASRFLLCRLNKALSSPAGGSARNRFMETGVQGRCERLSLSHAAGIVPLCRMSCRPFRRG